VKQLSALPIPSLYEWAGGMPAIERLAGIFYRRVKDDPLLGPLFARMSPGHAKHVAHFIAEVFGGPARYTVERGGHGTMISRHMSRNLTPEQRARWVQLMVECADEAGLPDDPEFRSAFVAYLEWGSRIAVLNSRPGATPALDGQMPRWGWGVVVPGPIQD
jgi:hemoglobin